MTRRILTRLALPVVVLVTIVAIFQTRGGTGVHISGDLAADLRAALENALPGFDDASAPDAARLEVIAVTEWSKLAFVPGALPACGAPCSPESPLRLVRVIWLAPGGSRKQVFLNIEPALAPDATASGTFALSRDGAACLGRVLASEAQQLRGKQGAVFNCLPADQQATRWRLFGP